jgi:hypothetical protein
LTVAVALVGTVTRRVSTTPLSDQSLTTGPYLVSGAARAEVSPPPGLGAMVPR